MIFGTVLDERFGRRASLVGGALALCLLLAACSGSTGTSGSGSGSGAGGSGSGGSGSGAGQGGSTGGSDAWASVGVTFNPALAAQYRASAEFAASNFDCGYVGCASSGTHASNQSSAYALHGVHWGHSSGLTGAGVVVAVVDNGFRLTHQEFSGKTIHRTGTLPVADHGTHVASLIAGVKDGVGMHGIAPGADLHLTSIVPDGKNFDIANVTAGTLAAAGLGAVAQNNSWGFNVAADDLGDYINDNPSATLAQALSAVVGGGPADWTSYIDALDAFQQNGVVVFALSNDTSIASGDVMAVLPYFDSDLAEAWIAAVNGYYEVDSAGDIVHAVRISAPCGLAASFCLSGDGTTVAASAGSNSSYDAGTGTSYVAPQIAAAVALLAEAFPDLTPEEWAKRLLASADNSWFSTLGVPTSGALDFGNGVTHAYSEEWGHGVLDLEAALSPIGTVSVLSNGDTVATAARLDLTRSIVSTPASYGDSLAVALAGRKMAVFDALNRSFSLDPSVIVDPQEVTIVLGLVSGSASGIAHAPQGLYVHHTRDLGGAVNGFTTLGGRSSVLSMAEEAVLVASTGPMGAASLSAYGFAADHNTISGGSLAGVGLSLALPAGNGVASIGFGVASEQGGVLGLEGNPAFDFGDTSTLATFDLGFEQRLAPSLGIFGRVEYGIADAAGSGNLVASVEGMQFSGIEIGAVISDVVVDDDRLIFSLAQPMRIEAGAVTFNMPVGRIANGAILSESVTADLQSSGREIDLGLKYETRLPNSAALNLGLQYALDAGHVAGATAMGVAMGYNQKF